jgi:UV DNA damage endonuclease
VIPHLREGGGGGGGRSAGVKRPAEDDGEDSVAGGGEVWVGEGVKDGGGQNGDAAGEPAFDYGGANKRVYWPQGKEEWLRPKKRVRRAKAEEGEEADEEE